MQLLPPPFLIDEHAPRAGDRYLTVDSNRRFALTHHFWRPLSAAMAFFWASDSVAPALLRPRYSRKEFLHRLAGHSSTE